MAETKRFIPSHNPKIEELFPVVEDLAHFIHGNNIHAIVLGGLGAQPLAYMLKAVWKRQFPSTKPPVFVRIAQTDRRTKYIPKDELKQIILSRFARQKVSFEQNLLLLDEYVDSGKTFRRISSCLQELGAKKVLNATLTMNKQYYGFFPHKDFHFIGAISKGAPEFDGLFRKWYSEKRLSPKKPLLQKFRELRKRANKPR